VWGIGVTTLGYFLGEVDLVENNLEYAAIVIVAVSLVPVVLESRRSRTTPDVGLEA
jgi:membrane-associated protein